MKSNKALSVSASKAVVRGKTGESISKKEPSKKKRPPEKKGGKNDHSVNFNKTGTSHPLKVVDEKKFTPE